MTDEIVDVDGEEESSLVETPRDGEELAKEFLNGDVAAWGAEDWEELAKFTGREVSALESAAAKIALDHGPALVDAGKMIANFIDSSAENSLDLLDVLGISKDIDDPSQE